MAGNRGGGHRAPLPREVQVSRKMSWLLRHGAEKENLTLDARGFVNVQDFLNNRNLRSFKVTFEELRRIVQENDKQRFTLIPIDSAPTNGAGEAEDSTATTTTSTSSDNPKDYLIRANQGHTLKLESSDLLIPILEGDSASPQTAVHGTTHAAWPLILASGGLKPMGRTHVHFASGLPAGFTTIVEQGRDAVAAAPVISGMRKSSTVLIWVDVEKAMQAGIKFWRSDNGVTLTEGNEEGVVPVEFFRRVEDRTGEGVLVEDGKVVKDAPAAWAMKRKK